MPVGAFLNGDVTEEHYRRLTEKMFGNYPMRDDQAPDGLIVHTERYASQGRTGYYVYEVWESMEQFQEFFDTTLDPALRELLGDGPRPKPEFFDVVRVVKGPAG